MSVFETIRNWFRPTYILNASYDAARYSVEDLEHWKWCDNFSADSAHSPDIRETLRKRCRYEVQNNSYALGAGTTLAEVTVGVGPLLNISTANKQLNSLLEELFTKWFDDIRLYKKLQLMRFGRYQDGESIARIFKNYALPGRLSTDFQVLECERLKAPVMEQISDNCRATDGIELDSYKNPVGYWITKEHPGSMTGLGYESIYLPANEVIHYAFMKRAEQHRGVPELTSVLKLFAQLRRVTLAVATAFETSANIALLLHTDLPPLKQQEVKPGMTTQIPRGTMMTLANGWDATQIKAEHPTTTFAMWRREMLAEIGRCMNMPVNIITGDSSGYNFASGRLDQQVFHKSVDVERKNICVEILDPLFRAGFEELVRLAAVSSDPKLSGLLPLLDKYVPGYQFGELPWHSWDFDNLQHVDPQKEESARKQRLENGVTNYQIECSKFGLDWEAVMEQRAMEQAYMKKLNEKYGLIEPENSENTQSTSKKEVKK